MIYGFDSSQTADRFLNRLKAGAVADVSARRHKGGTLILVRYRIPTDATFSTTCQELDDLAASLGGQEALP